MSLENTLQVPFVLFGNAISCVVVYCYFVNIYIVILNSHKRVGCFVVCAINKNSWLTSQAQPVKPPRIGNVSD